MGLNRHTPNFITTDLKLLVDQCKKSLPLATLETTPDFSPETEQKTTDRLDFIKLQDSGIPQLNMYCRFMSTQCIGDCSADSGIGQALLESPCIPPPSPSSPPPLTSTPFLRRQLCQLTPMPLSPQPDMYETHTLWRSQIENEC